MKEETTKNAEGAKAETSETRRFKVGDAVSWMNVKSIGRGIQLSRREGKIIEVLGTCARIKTRNGRVIVERLTDLRFAREKGQVTEVFEEMAASAKTAQ